MALTPRQLRYLKEMGIQPWRRRTAAGGDDLEETWRKLEAEAKDCTACNLAKTRTQVVFGVGNHKARWMLIGEAPGEQEDLKGEPFVGRAGKLLDEMLFAIGTSRQEVYITNTIKCRPPNNRDPKPEEIQACRPFLEKQIELISPELILAVGRIAAQSLLETKAPLSRLRGKVHRYRGIPLVVLYHPAYLLRNPAAKRQAWEDLKLALRVEKPNLN